MKPEVLYAKVISAWGVKNQIDQFHEEVGELMAAINKFKRGRANVDDVCTEIVDVQIMCEQLAVIFDEAKVAEQKKFKLERLEKRVEESTQRTPSKRLIFLPLYMRDDAEKRIKEKIADGNEEITYCKFITDIANAIPRREAGWAPNAEQLRVLKEAVAYFGEEWGSQKHKALVSLYEDLMKV